MIDKSTLYEQIGGASAVNVAVDIFYQKVLDDPLTRHFFDDIDMLQQKRKQKAFLSFVFGGPVNYNGKDMGKAHARLVTKGLAAEHFEAVVDHLQATLEELNVDDELIDEVINIAEGVRGDILGS